MKKYNQLHPKYFLNKKNGIYKKWNNTASLIFYLFKVDTIWQFGSKLT